MKCKTYTPREMFYLRLLAAENYKDTIYTDQLKINIICAVNDAFVFSFYNRTTMSPLSNLDLKIYTSPKDSYMIYVKVITNEN